MSDFLVKVRGEARGPYTTSQLHTQIRRKRLSRQHSVSSDGGVSWQRAGDLESLFPPASVREPEIRPPDREAIVDEPVEQLIETGEQQWSYSVMGQQLGPIPESEVRMLIASGGINHDTLLWQDGMTDWVQVQHIPTFTAAVRSRTSNESPTTKPSFAANNHEVSSEKTLHWPSLVALLTSVAAWTLLLPGAAISLGLSGVLTSVSSSRAESVLVRLVLIVLALSPSILLCIISIILGHKAVMYANREPGQYDGTAYSIFALILGYVTAVAHLGLAVICLVSASR